MKKLYLLLPLLLAGCSAPNSAITSCESQLAIRQIQTREYEAVTSAQAMRASIATLQDVDFVLDKVDATLGTISATKYHSGTTVKMTITVREKAPNIAIVRANATYGQSVVEDPSIYQDFFAMLDKSLFLVKNQVD